MGKKSGSKPTLLNPSYITDEQSTIESEVDYLTSDDARLIKCRLNEPDILQIISICVVGSRFTAWYIKKIKN